MRHNRAADGSIPDHDPEDAYENRQLTAGIGNDEGDDAEDTQDGREHYVEVGYVYHCQDSRVSIADRRTVAC